MKVLMIDQNYIVDRRIVLEAESLANDGHQLEIVAIEGKDDLNRNSSFKILRFPYLNTKIDLFDKLKKPLPNNNDQLIALKEKLVSKSIPNRIALLMAALSYPAEGLLLLETTQSLNQLSMIFLRLVFLLKLGEWKFVFKRFRPLFKINLGIRKERLNFWEAQVFRYAVANQFDIIHAHDLPSMNVAVEIKKRMKCKLIYDAHELYSYQPGIPKDKARQMFKLEKNKIKSFDHCIVINSEQAEIMRKDFNFHRFTPLTNATSFNEKFDTSEKYDIIREKLNLKNDEMPIILFQGGVNRLRKIDYLIEGVALAKKQVRLVLLTWGQEIPEFKELARKLGVAGRVHFVDPVPWQDVIFWAASADVGFMPYQPLDINTKLSCPNKMYEFINAGTPMIGSSELINVKKIVGDEGFGLVLPLREKADYADAIDQFFSMDQNVMKKALRQKMHKYTWETEAKKLVALYRSL